MREPRHPFPQKDINPDHAVVVVGECLSDEVWVKTIDRRTKYSATGYHPNPITAMKEAWGRLWNSRALGGGEGRK